MTIRYGNYDPTRTCITVEPLDDGRYVARVVGPHATPAVGYESSQQSLVVGDPAADAVSRLRQIYTAIPADAPVVLVDTPAKLQAIAWPRW